MKTLSSILVITALLGLSQLALADPILPHHHTAWHKADQNHDGRLGPAERQRARYLRHRADRNGDGVVGPRERRRAWRRL